MDDRIILASGSPRRKELLSLAGLRFEVRLPDVDEEPKKAEPPHRMVRRLSREKAFEVAKQISHGDSPVLVIAADTTVVSPDGKNLGKPRDEAEAVRMVNSLQGRTHRVHTGYSILKISGGKVSHAVSRVVTTRVTLRAMNKAEVRDYVSKGECLDKAGAYAAQGHGMALIEKISGSYTNVVGIPVTQVLQDLRALGWSP